MKRTIRLQWAHLIPIVMAFMFFMPACLTADETMRPAEGQQAEPDMYDNGLDTTEMGTPTLEPR